MIFKKCPKCKTELDMIDVTNKEKQIREIKMTCGICSFTSEITITSQGMFGQINSGKKSEKKNGIDLDKLYAESLKELEEIEDES